MIRLDVSTVLLQWSVGGLWFLWVTTRRRQIGVGYGWLLRSVYLIMAAGAVAAGRAVSPSPVRDLCGVGVVLAATAALVVSVRRRKAGVAGERALEERRSARVAAMTAAGPDPEVAGPDPEVAGSDPEVAGSDPEVAGPDPEVADRSGPPGRSATPVSAEFPPWLDLVAPVIGTVGLLAAALADGGPHLLAAVRTLAGAAFFGSVTDAMLLGHWYLVQPGLGRTLLNDMVRWVAAIWPIEVAALLWPTGMVQVLDGTIKDSYGGILGWFWVACVITTLALCIVTRAALKERAYSAVMAATGLLYLAILTAFGTDLVARAILAT